jgi:large subunit ribosomal protein L35
VPKQKTNSSAKKKFKISGAGKLLRRHAMQSHNLEKKTAKRRRGFRRDDDVAGNDEREAKRLLAR